MKRVFLIFMSAIALAACNSSEKSSDATTENVVSDSLVAAGPTVYENEYLVKVGDMAPDFTLYDTDGNEFTLSQMRGKVVMLQFTASWCGICRKEMPHIEERIWQRHKDNKNFVLAGVDREETKEVVDAYTEKLGTTYPMLLDEKGDVFASYAVRSSGITRNVLVDRDGRIVMLTRRYVEPEFDRLVATIDSLLVE